MMEMMEMTLTKSYRDYMHWLYEARKCKNDVPSPEVLENINIAAKQMTEFERDYANWVISLYKGNINVQEIKRQIKVLAKHLAEKEVKVGEGEVVKVDEEKLKELESCKPKNLRMKYWDKTKRFTQLCALRAAMHGRLHFSASSDLTMLRGYYGIDALTLSAQKDWVEGIICEFQGAE